MAGLLMIPVLPDGSVQGPESGGIAFGNNPSIAAGVNGKTLGVVYAGTGAMNDTQYSTVKNIGDRLTVQRCGPATDTNGP